MKVCFLLFSAYPVILILLNMFVIMIFLVNILIAQLSAKYEDAEKEAALQYNIDKAIFVTRIENSLLSCLGNMVRHFMLLLSNLC